MADTSVTLRTIEGGIPRERDPAAFMGGVLPKVPLVHRGRATTVGDVLANSAQLGHTAVQDADYQCLVTDVQVGMVVLTAPHAVSLPDVDAFPFGQDLVIADESGACSDVLTITIQPGSGTGDTIAGAASIILSSPYQAIRFRRGAANLWIRL